MADTILKEVGRTIGIPGQKIYEVDGRLMVRVTKGGHTWVVELDLDESGDLSVFGQYRHNHTDLDGVSIPLEGCDEDPGFDLHATHDPKNWDRVSVQVSEHIPGLV